MIRFLFGIFLLSSFSALANTPLYTLNTNGGFEEDTIGESFPAKNWDLYSDGLAYFTITDQAASGLKALRTDLFSYDRGTATQGEFVLIPGRQYRYSVQLNGFENDIVEVKILDQKRRALHTEEVILDENENEYQSFELNFVAGTAAKKISIQLTFGSTNFSYGRFFVDDAYLSPATAPLNPNSGFEHNDIGDTLADSWVLTKVHQGRNTFKITSDAAEGKQAMRVNVRSLGEYQWDIEMEQFDIPLEPGFYRLTALVKAPKGGRIDMLATDNNFSSYAYKSTIFENNTNDYRQIELPFTINEFDFVRVTFHFNFAENLGKKFYIDNAAVFPASISILPNKCDKTNRFNGKKKNTIQNPPIVLSNQVLSNIQDPCKSHSF